MGLFVFAIFVACAIYVQNRGTVQHDKLVRKFSDHSNVMAPINCLFYAFSKVKSTAYIDTKEFPELQVLQDNWQLIRDEALALNQANQIVAANNHEDLGFNSFFRTGWRRFYLTWYGADLVSAKALCPKTVALLESIPSVKAGMFAMLPPGAKLTRHRDPYAGSLRYHLGLVTPNDERCFINVDGQNYHWRDGEAVMFDETYLHFARNDTDQNRIVLFLDIKRPVTWRAIDWVNVVVSKVFMSASASRNTDADTVGVLNRIFPKVYKVRAWGKALKQRNRKLYYALQYGLYIALIALIFF